MEGHSWTNARILGGIDWVVILLTVSDAVREQAPGDALVARSGGHARGVMDRWEA